MTNDSLMKVESIAECSNAPLGAFCNTFNLHEAIIGLENQFLVFFKSGRFTQDLLYMYLYMFNCTMAVIRVMMWPVKLHN